MAAYIQEEGVTLPIEASPYQQGRLGPRENLLAALHAADRLLVLGEPGAGKTVALERLAWEACGGSEPMLPVLIRLFQYAGTPLAGWVRATLQQTGYLRLDDDRALIAFLHEGAARCLFLFDGLNEVPPASRDRLVDEVVRWQATYPRHPMIVTSRAQDELWRRLRGDVTRAVMIQPIADEQAQAYLVAHLPDKGAALYARLDERLRALARTPLLLWLIKEAGAAGEALPGNRGELYARFVSRLLRRDTERRLDAEIPERLKRQALTALAYHLSRQQRLACLREEAVQVGTAQLGERAETVLAACLRHGLLAGEETLWFAPHPTVQEHFAALALRARAKREWDRSWRERLVTRKPRVSALAADDGWGETFVQLASLLDQTQAERLAREVAPVNPWLAWWCVEDGRAVSEPVRQAIADRSVRLLDSQRVADRRRAVAALARLKSERVLKPLFRAAGDDDAEVAGLAVQTLAEMGEGAKSVVMVAWQSTEQRLWRAALRYAGTQPEEIVPPDFWERVLGFLLVYVPPGPFLVGSDRDRNPSDRPPARVTAE